MGLSGNGVIEVIISGGVIRIINAELSSTALANAAVNCVGGVGLLSVEAVVLDRLRMQHVITESSSTALSNSVVDCVGGVGLLSVEAVLLGWSHVQRVIFSVVGVVIGIIVVGGSVRKSSSMSFVTLEVDCVGGCDSWMVDVMVAGFLILVFSVVVVISVIRVVFVVRIVGSIIQKLSLASSLASTVDCVSSFGSWEVEAWSGVSPVFSSFVVSVCAVVCIVICNVVVGKSSSTSSMAALVGAGGCLGLRRVGSIVVGQVGSLIVEVSVFSLFSVGLIEKSSSSSVVVIVARKSSSAASAPLVVVCGGCWGWSRVGTFPLIWAGSLSILLSVVLFVLGVFVVGCIVIVGCIVVISIVVGIVRRVSCIKPARMLAFSASKSMRCGGGVMGR